MTATSAPIEPPGSAQGIRAPLLRTQAEALRAADELARQWRRLGPLRDQDRAVPRPELRLLAQSGLLGLMVPVEHGGAGLPTDTLMQVFATLSAADTALAQVPQNHFGGIYGLSIEPDQDAAHVLFAEALRGARFGNAGHERGTSGARARKPATTLTPSGDGFALDGVKTFTTGALTADWVPTTGSHPDGWVGTAFVPQGTPGMDIKEDWDAYGQRATVSGTAVFADARVQRRYVFSSAGRDKADTAFRYARSQITHAALQLGAAREALAIAARIDPDGLRPGLAARFEFWRDELILDIEATALLIRRAAERIDDVVDAGRATRDSALAVGIAVDEAKTIAYDLGPNATDGLIEFVGPQILDSDPGFDRFWRNARVHSLHDPIRWRRHYIGAYRLTGAFPPFMKSLTDTDSNPPL